MSCTDPGVFEFEKPSFLIKESVGVAQIPVTRANGCDGRVAVHWETKDLTAVSGEDYGGGEGSLVFEHGETTKMIDIAIINDLVRRFSTPRKLMEVYYCHRPPHYRSVGTGMGDRLRAT